MILSRFGVMAAAGGGGYGDSFVMTVRTVAPNETFLWPHRAGGVYSCEFDWGDGTVQSVTTTPSAHTYIDAGYYDIKITGTCSFPYFSGATDRLKLIEVKNLGNIAEMSGQKTLRSAFYGCTNLKRIIAGKCDTAITSIRHMLQLCSNLEEADLSALNTSAVTDAAYLLSYSTKVKTIGAGAWMFPVLTSATSMFEGASLYNEDLSNWCVPLIATAPTGFSTSSSLAEANKPIWGSICE